MNLPLVGRHWESNRPLERLPTRYPDRRYPYMHRSGPKSLGLLVPSSSRHSAGAGKQRHRTACILFALWYTGRTQASVRRISAFGCDRSNCKVLTYQYEELLDSPCAGAYQPVRDLFIAGPQASHHGRKMLIYPRRWLFPLGSKLDRSNRCIYVIGMDVLQGTYLFHVSDYAGLAYWTPYNHLSLT